MPGHQAGSYLKTLWEHHPKTALRLDGSAYTVEARAGTSPAPGDRSTHKAVLQCFRDNCKSHPLLSQHIALTDPLKWLMDRREEANYKHARFPEPAVPPHFDRVVRDGFRRSVSAYLHPRNQALAFDPDHAMIAFPLAVVRHARDELRASGIEPLDDDGAETIEPHCVDERGHRFGGLLRFLKD